MATVGTTGDEFRKKLAAMMVTQGVDASPVQHWTQGAARLAQALVGGRMMRDIDARDREASDYTTRLATAMLGGAGGTPALTGETPAMPLPSPQANTSGKIYANDEPSPLDPPSGKDRDLAIRTILAEAGNQGPEGMQAVGSVIRNRAVSGKFGGDTPTGVVTAPNQFEPWNTAAGRSRMAAIDPNSQQYQAADQALARAYFGDDPTKGATHFFAPKAQAALGRSAPAWGRGPGQDIGDHRFFGGAAAPQQTASASPGFVPQGRTTEITAGQQPAPAPTPAAPMPQMAQSSVPPQLIEQIRVGLQSPNPQIRAQAAQAAASIQSRLMKRPEYDYKQQPDGSVLAINKSNLNDRHVIPGDAQSRIQFEADQEAAKVGARARASRAAEEGMPASTEVTSKLRNEVQGLPSYKNLAQAAPVYKSMTEAAGRDNRAADVNLIYGMAKIMDPGSVVRESEMSVASAIATLPQQLQAAVTSQLQATGRLTPEIRAAIMQEARSRVLAYQGMFDQDMTMYRGIAERGRMNALDVIPTFGPFDEFKMPPPAATTPPPATAPVVIDGYKIRPR